MTISVNSAAGAKGNEANFITDSSGNVVGLAAPNGSDTISVDIPKRRPLRAGVLGNVASGELFCDLTTATFGGVGGGSGSVAGAVGAYGTTPIDLVVAAGSTSNTATATVSGSFGSFLDNGGPFLVVAEIISGFTTNDTLKLAVSSDAFATKSETATYTHHAYREGGLIYFAAYPNSNAFVAAGSETFSSTMNALQITATSAGGTVGGTLRVHGVWKGHRALPTVTIQFDDGWATQYQSAFQYMAARGLVGDIGVIASRVGTAGYCTLAQLQEMYAAGWGMVVHGNLHHNDASFTTRAQIVADIETNRDYILANLGDRGAYHYIYPGGIVNTTLGSRAALVEAGMRSGRLVTSQINGRKSTGIDNPMAMFARDLSSAYSAASDLTLLDRSIEAGASVIFYGHKLVRTGATSGIEMNYSEFQTLIDGVSDRVRDGKVRVVTQSQLIDGH